MSLINLISGFYCICRGSQPGIGQNYIDGFGFATKSEALLAPIHSRVPASTEIHTMRLETTHRFDTVYCSYHPKVQI